MTCAFTAIRDEMAAPMADRQAAAETQGMRRGFSGLARDSGDRCESALRGAQQCGERMRKSIELGEMLSNKATTSLAVVAMVRKRTPSATTAAEEGLDGEFAMALSDGGVLVKMVNLTGESEDQSYAGILREAMVGYALRERVTLPGLTPCFSYVYDTIVCGDVFKQYGNAQGQLDRRVAHIFQEAVGPRMFDYLMTEATDFLLCMLFEAMHALQMAYNEIRFVHYDMHLSNLRVKKLPAVQAEQAHVFEVGDYEGGGGHPRLVSIPHRMHRGYVAKIIDYGRCRADVDTDFYRGVSRLLCGAEKTPRGSQGESGTAYVVHPSGYDEFGIPTDPQSFNVMRDVHEMTLFTVMHRAHAEEARRTGLSDAIDELVPYKLGDGPILASLLLMLEAFPVFGQRVAAVFQYVRMANAGELAGDDACPYFWCDDPAAAMRAPDASGRQSARSGIEGFSSVMLSIRKLMFDPACTRFAEMSHVGAKHPETYMSDNTAIEHFCLTNSMSIPNDWNFTTNLPSYNASVSTAGTHRGRQLAEMLVEYRWAKSKSTGRFASAIIAAKSIVQPREPHSVASMIMAFIRSRYGQSALAHVSPPSPVATVASVTARASSLRQDVSPLSLSDAEDDASISDAGASGTTNLLHTPSVSKQTAAGMFTALHSVLNKMVNWSLTASERFDVPGNIERFFRVCIGQFDKPARLARGGHVVLAVQRHSRLIPALFFANKHNSAPDDPADNLHISITAAPVVSAERPSVVPGSFAPSIGSSPPIAAEERSAGSGRKHSVCALCGSSDVRGACSICQDTFYCSTVHQQFHWNFHLRSRHHFFC